MSRMWCPAIAADAATTFDAAHLGRQQSASPTRIEDEDSKTKSVSARAAHVAASSVQRVHDAATKIASSPPSKFSAKVAASTRPDDDSCAAFHITCPQTPLVAVVDDEAAPIACLASLPQPVVVRSLAHLAVSTGGADGGLPPLVHVDVSRVDATSEELATALADLSASAEGISVRHSIRGTLGVAAALKALGGSDAGNVRSLDIGNNPAAFSLGGVDEPNTTAAEELVKYLQATPGLRRLGLSCTGLAAASASILPAIKAHSGLISLDASRNGLGLQQEEAAVAALVQLVQEDKFLLRLDLSDNDIGGPLAKQLLEALQNSDTRVKTPEAEPEPEAEEYTDEVPPEEEAPTVVVGLPEEEQAAGGGEAPPTEEGSAPAQPPPDVDTTVEPEDGDAEGEAPPADAAAAEEEDPEAAEAARLEAEEAAVAAQKLKEEVWRGKMQQFVWEPEQILFQYQESVARRTVTADYVTTTLALKKDEKSSRAEYKNRQLQRERAERDRRSGWSHLQDFCLNGNPIGNQGAKILALALRYDLPMTAEEIQAAEESYEKLLMNARSKARAEIKLERQRMKEEEAAAAASAAAAAAASAAEQVASQPATSVEGAAPEAVQEQDAAPEETTEATEDGANEAINAEDAIVEDEAIPPVPEDAVEGEDIAPEGNPEGEEDADEAIDVSHVTVPAPLTTKPGLRTVQSLRLDQCAIGTNGLKCLAAAVGGECRSLQLMTLRKNKFGTKKQSVAVVKEEDNDAKPDEEEGGDEEGGGATIKVDVPTWVSPGLAAFAAALSTAPSLSVLDLSWNRLYPESIRTLAAGIRENRTLTWLGLDGNHIGYVEEVRPSQSALSVLLEAVATQGAIHTLLLGSCALERSFGETEATLLATIPELQHLNLSVNQLSDAQLAMWGQIGLNLEDDVPRTTLRTLLLENMVSLSGADGGAAVASVVVNYCSTLTTLSLRGCQQLGDAGVERLMTHVGKLAVLERLSLSRCGVVTTCELVATALAQRIDTLQDVAVGDNEVDSVQLMQCVDILSSAAAERAKEGKVVPLKTLSIWSRSGDSEDLLPSLLKLTLTARRLTNVDVGMLPVFAKPAVVSPAVEGTEAVVYEDVFEELEKQCLLNRIASAVRV